MNKGVRHTGELIRFVNSPQDVSWDVETDVLVIGGGGCGLIAALAAAEKGAHVFVVEKEKAAGGNTSLSQAMVPAAGTSFQKQAGIEDSIDLMAEDILKKNKQGSAPDLTRHVAAESSRLVEWLDRNMGI